MLRDNDGRNQSTGADRSLSADQNKLIEVITFVLLNGRFVSAQFGRFL